MEVIVILHNIRSAHNVGSIFRTADAAGVSKIFLTGYTPAPIDRFGRADQTIAKTALGGERYVPSEQMTFARAIQRLKKEKFAIVGIEQDRRSKDYRKFRYPKKTALILGNEVHGLAKSVRDTCDALVEIPMRGKKESLNVSVAAGIVLFEVLKRR